MLSRLHLRMARAALDWTLKDLADKAGVNLNTISRYEAGGSMLSDTLEKIEAVLRREGIVFIEADEQCGPGIRVRQQPSDLGERRQKKKLKRSKKSN